MDIFYVALTVLIIIGLFIVILKVHRSFSLKKEIQEFKTRYSGAPLAEFQKRALGYGAILSCSRNEGILTLVPNQQMKIYQFGLQKQWQITDHDSAVESLNHLLKMNRSQEFDQFIISHANNKDLIAIYKTLSIQLQLPEAYIFGITSTYAWDIGRAVSVAKWCFWLNYINEQELNVFFEEADLLVSKQGKDWIEYTCSFLLGRCIQGFKLNEVIDVVQQLLKPSDEWLKKVPDIDIYQKVPFKSSL